MCFDVQTCTPVFWIILGAEDRSSAKGGLGLLITDFTVCFTNVDDFILEITMTGQAGITSKSQTIFFNTENKKYQLSIDNNLILLVFLKTREYLPICTIFQAHHYDRIAPVSGVFSDYGLQVKHLRHL